MARKPRVYFPGAIYHVICRGNNREWIFNTDTDKRSYLSLISKYKERYGFTLYAWAILSNHVHLLIEVNEVPLSKIMQGIQQSYTGRYNHFNERTGHVFEQRYKAFLCYDEPHLLSLIRYIHHNPVRAGLEGGLNHSFSSHQAYVSHQSTGFTDTDYPLRLFATERQTAIQSYSEFIMQDDQLFNPEQATRADEERKSRPTIRRQEAINVPLAQLVSLVAEFSSLDVSDLTGGSRRRELVAARRVLVKLCVEHTRISRGELGNFIGVSDTAISKAIRFMPADVNERVSQLLDPNQKTAAIKWPRSLCYLF